MSFLLLLISIVQKNWRKGQNRFCLEEKGVEGIEWMQRVGGRNGPNNVCTYE
jgi:hypothetical protein